MDGCHEARTAVSIKEIPCPTCGKTMEVFLKDGLLAEDAVCESCGLRLSAGINPGSL